MTTNNERSLKKICSENNFCFSINLLGNNYCSIARNNIECEYFGEKDGNNLNVCTYFNKTEERVDLN